MPLLPHPAPSCRLEYGHDRWCPSSHRGPRVTLRTKATNKEGEQKESRSQRHTSLGLTTSTFHLMSSLCCHGYCVSSVTCNQNLRVPHWPRSGPLLTRREFQARGNSLPRESARTLTRGRWGNHRGETSLLKTSGAGLRGAAALSSGPAVAPARGQRRLAGRGRSPGRVPGCCCSRAVTPSRGRCVRSSRGLGQPPSKRSR